MKYILSSIPINLQPENLKLRPKMDKNQKETKTRIDWTREINPRQGKTTSDIKVKL